MTHTDVGRRERAERWGREWGDGMTLQEIGDREHVTRERVRQVIAEFADVADDARARRDERRRIALYAERRSKQARKITKSNRKGFPRVYSDDELVGWLEAFLDAHEPPYSSLDWIVWLKANGGPNGRTVAVRLGGWQEIADRYGFETPLGRGVARTRLDCIRGLIAVASRLGRFPTHGEYDRHRPRNAPCGGTVRARLSDGHWYAALRTIMPYTGPPTHESLRYPATDHDGMDTGMARNGNGTL